MCYRVGDAKNGKHEKSLSHHLRQFKKGKARRGKVVFVLANAQ